MTRARLERCSNGLAVSLPPVDRRDVEEVIRRLIIPPSVKEPVERDRHVKGKDSANMNGRDRGRQKREG